MNVKDIATRLQDAVARFKGGRKWGKEALYDHYDGSRCALGGILGSTNTYGNYHSLKHRMVVPDCITCNAIYALAMEINPEEMAIYHGDERETDEAEGIVVGWNDSQSDYAEVSAVFERVIQKLNSADSLPIYDAATGEGRAYDDLDLAAAMTDARIGVAV